MSRMVVTLFLSVVMALVVGVGGSVALFSPSESDGASYESVETQPFITRAVFLPRVVKAWDPCFAAPAQLSPSDGATLSTLIPVFYTSLVDDLPVANFGIEVSKYSSFTSTVFVMSTSDPYRGTYDWASYYNLEPGALYYWRAWQRCSGAAKVVSPIWTFTSGSGGTVPAKPGLVAPSNGASNLSRFVQVSWQPVSGANQYQLCLRASTSQSGFCYGTAGTSYSVPGLAASTQYSWSVSAANDYAWSQSDTWTFTTAVTASIGDDSAPASSVEARATGCMSVQIPEREGVYCD